MSNDLDSIKVLLLEEILATHGTIPRSNRELRPIFDMFSHRWPEELDQLRNAVRNWSRQQGPDSEYYRIKDLLDRRNAHTVRNTPMAP